MADPEEIYQQVLQEEQAKGSSGPVAEARAKAARARAEAGSPHPTEPKWWPGAQPHLEGGEGAGAETPAAEAAEEPTAEAPAAEPPEKPAEQPAAEQPQQPAAEKPAAQPVEEAPAKEQAPAPAAPAPASTDAKDEPAAAAVPPAPAPVEAPAPVAAATAEPAAPAMPSGVTHGTTTGTRLRPEDEVSTDAQFEGQKAMYERRKLIDELVATGVPEVTAATSGGGRAPFLLVLYLLIPVLAIGFLAGQRTSAPATEATEETATAEGGSTTLVASGIQWDPTTLTIPAGKESQITMDNQDPSVHNLEVFKTEEDAGNPGSALYTSPDVPASTSEEITIDPLDKGSYYFHCAYHPSMKGTLEVE